MKLKFTQAERNGNFFLTLEGDHGAKVEVHQNYIYVNDAEYEINGEHSLVDIAVKINGSWVDVYDIYVEGEDLLSKMEAEVNAESAATSAMAKELSSPQQTGRI